MKKSEIEEIIDTDGNLIGLDDTPKVSADLDTMANKTTDYNATVHGQNYKNDFLGRFGFYFYESEKNASNLEKELAMIMYEKFLESLKYYHENPDLLNSDYKEHFADNVDKEDKIDDTDRKWAKKIMDLFEPHLKKDLNEAKKVLEDKVLDKDKKKKKMKSEKDDDKELSAKAKKIASLINDLPKNQRDKLKNIIEGK